MQRSVCVQGYQAIQPEARLVAGDGQPAQHQHPAGLAIASGCAAAGGRACSAQALVSAKPGRGRGWCHGRCACRGSAGPEPVRPSGLAAQLSSAKGSNCVCMTLLSGECLPIAIVGQQSLLTLQRVPWRLTWSTLHCNACRLSSWPLMLVWSQPPAQLRPLPCFRHWPPTPLMTTRTCRVCL